MPAGSDDQPSHYKQLSKKCRRLLDLACQRGKVEPRGNGSHFESLVSWGLLNEDGTPTKKGRDWYGRQPSDRQSADRRPRHSR